MTCKLLASLAAGAALLAAGSAQAQSWGWNGGGWNGSGWNGGGYNDNYGRDGRGWGWGGGQVCSGQRGNQLEDKLRHEWNEGEIDPRTAQRIQREIDKLQNKQREECYERDWGAVRGIAERYDRIDGWIDREAHGYRRW